MSITCDRWVKSTNSPCKHYLPTTKPKEAGLCLLSSKFRCIESLKKYAPTLSQSSAKTFAQCHYKYYLSKVLGIRPHDHMMPNPIKLGAIWDGFIEARVQGKNFNVKFQELSNKYQLWDSDISKLKALMKAFHKLDLNIFEPDPIPQEPIAVELGDLVITGFTDISYDFHLQEFKLSGRPDYLTKLENIHTQAGTYLMANPKHEYIDMMITRVPMLKTGKGKMSDESNEAYTDRLYKDIMKRPGYYFIGYKKRDRVYGKRFWASEFNFDEIRKFYIAIRDEMQLCIHTDSWYKNDFSCGVPTPCWFQAHKKSGVFSEKIYQIGDKAKAAKGLRG